MKTVRFFSAIVATSFLFLSCVTNIAEIDIEETEFTDELVPNTEIKTYNVTDAINLFEVTPGVGEVTLNNVQEKEIFVISQNNTSRKIDSKNALSIASLTATGRAAFKEQEDYSQSEKEINEKNGFTSVTIKPISEASLELSSTSRAASTGTFNKGVPVKVGSKKMLFVDKNSNLTEFTKKSGKLEYSGKYCNIWSIENDSILDSNSCKDLANTFDRYYIEMRSIFGNESDKIYIYNGSKFVLDDMSRHTNTENKVNIVVYTISQPSIIGYFHSKDYYETAEELKASTGKSYAAKDAANYSNCGKYFYINYRYITGSTSDKLLAESTIVHEFQHMINFSVKNMNGLRPSTWYNEMLSMLAEDMLSERIKSGTKAPSVMRMNTFLNNYYKSGLIEFTTTYSYGTAYAFGAWLVRNFGGTAFINMVMKNRKVDEDSIVSAVNAISPKKYDFNSLFNEYVQSCVNAENFDAITETSDVNGEKYIFTKINNSPIVRPIGKNSGTNIEPYGFVVRKVEATAPSITISLSERTKREKVYIIAK